MPKFWNWMRRRSFVEGICKPDSRSWDVTLSDLSSGMVMLLGGIWLRQDEFQIQEMDAQSIPIR